MKITKDMTISEVLRVKPETESVFRSIGMHCLGCAVSTMETVEQAADVHGIDLDELLDKLNKV